MTTYHNPILPGFYPDPSICRVGEDYYLVTSTFEYFPGVPIFHSRDLVHWRQIGHILTRPSQLNLDNVPASYGIYAPTIRYHDGTFYMITTLRDAAGEDRNFIVTASDPAGPWSEPYFLNDAPKIDPSLLFDADGRVWYTGNRIPPTGEQFHGEREIWLQELDLQSIQLVGEKYSIWNGALRDAPWAEAPHLYKLDGWYYLMIAEGGTMHNHAVTIARSHSITGPYENNPANPILTHRHLGQDYPIVNTGHADFVQTQNGEWWMVLLASRPYGGYYRNLGRETFLVPMHWENGWPIISPGIGRVEFEHPAPNLPIHRWPQPSACDHFDMPALDFRWNFLRTPRDNFWSLAERPDWLRLKLRRQRLSEQGNPSFVGQRQRHLHFSAHTFMEFDPGGEHEEAGMVLLQNNDYHFRFVCTYSSGQTVLRLIRREAGEETILVEKPVNSQRLYLRVEAHEQDYSFAYAEAPANWSTLYDAADGRILSTDVAGGFVGAYLGIYATSSGQASDNVADFDYFEYLEVPS